MPFHYKGYEVISKSQMSEKKFIELILAIAQAFGDNFFGDGSVEPISWDFVQGTDHVIACLFAQRYGNSVGP